MPSLKNLWIYGVLAACVIMILFGLEYSIKMRSWHLEIWIALSALLFVGLGIWVAVVFFGKKEIGKGIRIDLTKNEEIGLSDRELDVLQAVMEGLSNQEVADKLHISIPTVKTHLSNIFVKMEVKRRTQAVQKAVELGLMRSQS